MKSDVTSVASFHLMICQRFNLGQKGGHFQEQNKELPLATGEREKVHSSIVPKYGHH